MGNYNLASHTVYLVCVNFILEWQDLQYKVDTEQQIFEKLFQSNFFFIYSENFWRQFADIFYISYIHTYIHNWSLQPFSHDY